LGYKNPFSTLQEAYFDASYSQRFS
jgi:hypothetical protein